MTRWLLAAGTSALLITGVAVATADTTEASTTETEVTSEPAATTAQLVVYHCDVASTACWVCVDRVCEKPEEQVFCCPIPGGECAPAQLMTDCDPNTSFAVYCGTGQSSPQTNPDGSEGFICLD